MPNASASPSAVASTVMRTDGRPDASIVVHNEAARAPFATVPGDPAGAGALQRHFVDPAAAERLLRLALTGCPAREELQVHTARGVERLLVELSRAHGESAGPLVLLTEEAPLSAASPAARGTVAAPSEREQEFAENAALLHATLDNMEQGLLVLDADLKLKLWNGRFRQLFDIPPDQMWPGRPVEELMRNYTLPGETLSDDPEATLAARLGELRHAAPILCELLSPNGRIIERRLSPMPDGRLLATYLDVTERKTVEADLRRAKDEAELASRSKTEFLANMSHELRTPLNAIIGFSDILTGQIFGPLGDRRYADYARDIRDSGQHLLNLINDVLDVSKVEFGKIELIEETIDVTSVVESCVRLMRDRAEAAGVRLLQSLPEDLPFLHADNRRFKQILLNLLSNAVKFTLPTGRVSILAVAGDDGFRLIVEDTGIGIAPADLEKALKPFGQIDSRLARKYQGSGLGLPLTKSMVELHGGRLELSSTPGSGTTAVVWLPPARMVWPLLAAERAVGEA
jgi:signal transduction histidine kinase